MIVRICNHCGRKSSNPNETICMACGWVTVGYKEKRKKEKEPEPDPDDVYAEGDDL